MDVSISSIVSNLGGVIGAGAMQASSIGMVLLAGSIGCLIGGDRLPLKMVSIVGLVNFVDLLKHILL